MSSDARRGWIERAVAVLRDCRGPINAWPQCRDTLVSRIDGLLFEPVQEESQSADSGPPFAWIELELRGRGDTRLADGVRELLWDRNFQRREVMEERALRLSTRESPSAGLNEREFMLGWDAGYAAAKAKGGAKP